MYLPIVLWESKTWTLLSYAVCLALVPIRSTVWSCYATIRCFSAHLLLIQRDIGSLVELLLLGVWGGPFLVV